jgi:DNA polymerase III subunit alpha
LRHVELHNHTHYSLLDGASTPQEYLRRAKELGMQSLAITDHGSTAGWREFQRDAKEIGIKPILGVEAYITPDRFDRRTAAKREDGTGIYNHITLLAMNEIGMKNIEQMNKVAWEEGFFHKPRIDLSLLEQYNEGVIALSGCMSGMIAKTWLNGDAEGSRKYASRLTDILGDRFYIEVMESNDYDLNNYLVKIAKTYGLKPVVTSDCHMAKKEDLARCEAMKILGIKSKKRDDPDYPRVAKMQMLDAINYLYPERQMSFMEFELWLHTYDEHVENLAKHDIGTEAIESTVEIESRIGDYPYYANLETLPPFPDAEDEVIELRERLERAIKEKGLDTPENRKRVFEIELPTIEAKKLSGYFLIEADFMRYAKENDILTGYGRGSAVSYLSNYLLDITGINPMPYNLLPERFLSLDRSDPADVDSDFAIEGRYKVKAYAQRKYPYVSNIATIGYYKDKSAIKAAAKVFGANYNETQKLNNKITSIEEFETHPETQEYQRKYPHVIPLAKQLDGKIQNFGMHAGGIILSREPIENHVPMQTAEDPSDKAAGRVPVAAADMRELADIGYVKYDLLGLRTLSIIDDCIKLIKQRHGIDIDISDVPTKVINDSNLYKMISQGRVAGLFQTDTGPGIKTIFEMGGINNFAELVASNALVRPGAANSTVGETYINGKLTGNIKSLHPKIDPVLEETYGAVLYQEQQLLLCEYIAGMSKADANKVRKAISKKIPEDLAIWKEQFITGATENVGETKAKAIWKDLEASADYAFAKAHAVGYSMLTLLTAYLKYYYPIEFLVSNLNRMSGNKTDRMKTLKYLIEAKRLGIRVRLPHVNASDVKMTIDTDEKGDFIRMGLSQIKFISGKNVGPLMRGVPYDNYQAMLDAKLNKAVLNALNAVGAAAFEDNPRTGNEPEKYFEYLSLPAFDTRDIPPKVLGQFRELKDFSDDSTFVCMGLVGGEKKKAGKSWRIIDIVDETAVASVFTIPEIDNIEVGGVYIFLISNNSVVKWMTTEEFINDKGGAFQEFLEAESFKLNEGEVRVVSFNTRTTKAGKKMANIIFADENKEMISAIVWPNDFPKAHTRCKEGAVVEALFSELDNGGYVVTLK